MNKQRIWIVSEVFFPDTDIATANIATEIAIKFKESFEVHVICGPQDYERKNQEKDGPVLEGIHIHRWEYFNFDKNHKLKRLLRVVGISLGLFLLSFRIQRADKAFVISNPAFITPLYGFLKWLKGFEYILLMHDVFPENLVVGGYVKEKNFLYGVTKSIFTRSRLAADKIIVIGRDMKTLLLEKFPKNRAKEIVIIPNWSDIKAVFPYTEKDTSLLPVNHAAEKIVILFAGNHGVLQNLMEFLKIIEKVKNDAVHYVFAGGGATKKELQKYATANKMSNVSFLPPFSKADNNKILNSCDIGLVSLTDSLYGVGVPSKSYNILAAGKPILFLGNTKTEIGQFVQENDIGWAYSYSDSEGIIAFLESLNFSLLPDIKQKGAKARFIIEQEYHKDSILERLKSAIA